MKLKEKIRKYNEQIILAVGAVLLLFYLILAFVYYFRYSLKDSYTAISIFAIGLIGIIDCVFSIGNSDFKLGTKIFIIIVGISFMLFDVLYYISSVRHYNSVKKIIDNQQYVYAEYDHIENITRLDSSAVYHTVLKYTDEISGETSFFQTCCFIFKSHTPVKKNEAVKVYVDLSTPDLYLISYKEKK